MHIPENIYALINKYLSGTLNAREYQLLDEWYRSFADDEEQLFSDEKEQNETAERIAARIAGSIDAYRQLTRARSYKKRRRLYMAAATVLILLSSFGVYRYFVSPDSSNQVIISQGKNEQFQNDEIKPGGNKALLVLANGSTIVLDSASNGTLSRQGNIQVLKLDNGLLSYTGQKEKGAAHDDFFFNTISTPRGGQYQVTLSDGTKVWLNAASSIRFPVAFTRSERRVSVTGEVYFEVAHDKQKPFKVEVNNNEIEVLGTHFNINAYHDEAALKTTLLEGKIKQTVSGGATQVILLPGQQSHISGDGRITVKKNVDTEEAVAWMHGNFQFKSADLHTILRQVARWYDVEIEYRGHFNLHFTGQLPRSENVNTLFKHLALTGEVHFKIKDRKIIVSP
ncbi:MAG: FecR domain-containing protein [Agriterribacter sp.]